MKRRAALVAGGLALAAVFALFGYGLTQAGAAKTQLLGSGGAGTPLAGKPAPAFTLDQLGGGETLSLAQFRGKVVVVNFWASWCVGCRREHPALMAAFERYRDRGVVFLGILFQDSPAGAQGFLKQFGDAWPTLLDPGSKTAVSFGVYGVPETFFIARDGTIAYRNIGESTYDLVTSKIEPLLEKQ